jgi:hypothetical protein
MKPKLITAGKIGIKLIGATIVKRPLFERLKGICMCLQKPTPSTITTKKRTKG